MKVNSPLILDVPLIDWLTLTSFEGEFQRYWIGRFRERGKHIKTGKILQYDGDYFELDGGTGFLGAAIQNGRVNYMLRLSGNAAEDNKSPAILNRKQGIARCTRIDIQITTDITHKWSQWDLLTRLKSRGKMTGWIESKSKGKGYETVYIGSRQSERFTRIYIKQADNPRLLRLETEYKGNRANAILRELGNGKLLNEFTAYEVQTTIKDKGISAIFEPLLSGVGGYSPRLVPSNSLEKQEKWLLEQVLPSFTRHLNDHNNSGRVLDAFAGAITDALERP